MRDLNLISHVGQAIEILRHPVASQRQLLKDIHNDGREMDEEQRVRGLKLVAGGSDRMNDPIKL